MTNTFTGLTNKQQYTGNAITIHYPTKNTRSKQQHTNYLLTSITVDLHYLQKQFIFSNVSYIM